MTWSTNTQISTGKKINDRFSDKQVTSNSGDCCRFIVDYLFNLVAVFLSDDHIKMITQLK